MVKMAGVNIPAQLTKHGEETVTDELIQICTEAWRTGEWITLWTQSLIVCVGGWVCVRLRACACVVSLFVYI